MKSFLGEDTMMYLTFVRPGSGKVHRRYYITNKARIFLRLYRDVHEDLTFADVDDDPMCAVIATSSGSKAESVL
jgi:hypothetical protein